MGVLVKVTSNSPVVLPPSGLTYTTGNITALTSAEYAGLSVSTKSKIAVIQPGIPDPPRVNTGTSVISANDALQQAKAYTDSAVKTLAQIGTNPPAEMATHTEVASAVQTSKSYADTRIGQAITTEQTARNAADASTLTSAESYTDSATVSALATVNSQLNSYTPKLGSVILPAPSGDTTTDSAALQAAITSIMATPNKTGVIQARAGTYKIAGYFSFGDYYSNSAISLLGMGGGSESANALTTFQCQTATTQFEFPAGGGVSGHFHLDGNNIARSPFVRSGGGGASGRTFMQMHVTGLVGKSDGSGQYDTATFIGAQNDLWLQCQFSHADRDLAHFSQGYGGAHFVRCEWNGTIGRYGHMFDEAITSQYQVYPRCTDLTFTKGILEGTFYGGNVREESCDLINHTDYVYVNGVAPVKGLFQCISGEGNSVHNTYMQIALTNNTITSNSRGFWFEGTSTLAISGRAQFNDLNFAWTMNGFACRAYMNATPIYFNCLAVVDQATNFLGVYQVADEKQYAIRSSVADPSYPTSLIRNSAGYFTTVEYGDGSRHYYTPGTFTDEVQFGRVGPGAVGVVGQQVLTTGSGTTAQRPDPTVVPVGSLFFDKTLSQMVWSDGTKWIAGVASTSNPVDQSSGSNGGTGNSSGSTGSSSLNSVDNGDGTATFTGNSVVDNSDGTFNLSDNQVVDNNDGTYSTTS